MGREVVDVMGLDDRGRNILFVCDGNICRSPMAQALMTELVSQRGLAGVSVSSAGLSAMPWTTADRRLSIVIGDAYKSLKGFQSRAINTDIVNQADLILVMENRHVEAIASRFPWAKGKVATVTSYAGEKGEIKDFGESGHSEVLEWLKSCHNTLRVCLNKVAEKVSSQPI